MRPSTGKGLLLTFQVEDATAEFKRLKGNGLEIAYPLHDEPWGQRRFAVRDPSGTWVDVIEQIDPAPGSGSSICREQDVLPFGTTLLSLRVELHAAFWF